MAKSSARGRSRGQAVAVRAARQGDLAVVCGLEQKCFTLYRLSRRQLRYLLGRRSVLFCVATIGGRVVGEGIGLIRRHRRVLSGRVYSLAVDPEFRGRGIGQKLLMRLLREFGGRGVKRVYLEVEQRNRGAIRLYEASGFQIVDTLPDYYGRGLAGVHMMCSVSKAVGK